jgi:hypothetical protein
LALNSLLQLPSSEWQLDVEALSRMFNDTTNSYKILFFRAVLLTIRNGQLKAQRRIPLADITAKMLVCAWIISGYYRLSFGSNDKLSSILAALSLDTAGASLSAPAFESRLEDQIRESFGTIDLVEIQRYAPYRLLRPFLTDETRGLPDGRVNKIIQECAKSSFCSEKPVPYIIVDKGEPYIELHEHWHSYFVLHLKILMEWTNWHLTSYLQRRNPNAPAIAGKLYLPKRRRPLHWQRRLWTTVFTQAQVRCIYSNEVISRDQFHLDHYLPWSFVCHDEAWNLIPVAPTVNLVKSNAIPSQRYLSAFIDLQARALSIAKDHLSSSDWETVSSSYAAGLRIDSGDFSDLAPLRRSFQETIPSLASIAKRMGFVSDWEFDSNQH